MPRQSKEERYAVSIARLCRPRAALPRSASKVTAEVAHGFPVEKPFGVVVPFNGEGNHNPHAELGPMFLLATFGGLAWARKAARATTV